MRKILYTLLIIWAFASCADKDSLIYDQKPEERVEVVLENYRTILKGAPNGWLLALNTSLAGGFNHWVKFTGNNTCEMLSDADANATCFGNSSTDVKESSWRVKLSNTPVLVFDTFNYIHMLADPSAKYGGVMSEGYLTDFEFTFVNYNEQTKTFELLGKQNKAKAYLIAVSEEQEEAIKAGGLKTMSENFKDVGLADLRYSFIYVGEEKVGATVNSRSLQLETIEADGKTVKRLSGAYLNLSGLTGTNAVSNLVLFDTLSYKGMNFTGVNYEDGKYYVLADDQKLEIIDNKKPFIPVVYGPGRDYNSLYIYLSYIQGSLLDPYLTNVYYAAVNSLKSAYRYTLNYYIMTFINHPSTKEPVLRVIVSAKTSANQTFQTNWYFYYTVNEDGTYTFTGRDQASVSCRYMEPPLKMMLDYLCGVEYDGYNSTSATEGSWEKNKARITKVTPKTFKIDWAENNTSPAREYAGFYPVDQAQMEEEGVMVGYLGNMAS